MITFEHKQIFENLYGGSPFNPKDIRRWFKNAKLKLPVNVIAVELKKHSLETLTFNSQELKAWIIDSDRNMLYITYNGLPEEMKQICDKQALLHGDSILCDDVTQWIWALRKAISSTRQHYLTRLSNAALGNFTWADEREQFSVAMEAFLQEHSWQKTVNLWLDIVLIRHQETINDCRRKILSFLIFATVNIDMNTNLSFIFRQAVIQLENTYAFSCLRQIVLLILENMHPYVIFRNPQQALLQGIYPEPVEKALVYMRKSYTLLITRKDVSAACFVSPEYLSRLFKDKTSYTITEYLQILRVDHAKQLLVESKKGILSVAMESGFNSIAHFHRVFKKQTKMTPHYYRKVHSIKLPR